MPVWNRSNNKCIHPTQGQHSSPKIYHCLSPGEHNLKGLPNCNVISCIIFNKSLNIIYAVSKNRYSTCFLHTASSPLYLVSHRMTVSTNIRLLRAVFTIQGYTGLYRAIQGSKLKTTVGFFAGDVTNPVDISRVSCLGSAKAVQFPLPGQKLATSA